MNVHRPCWLVLTAALLAPSARAAIDVHLSVARHTEASADTQHLPPDRHDDIDATLGDTWMIVRHGTSTTTHFDFARRRRTEIDEARHTRVDYSLFDVVGFRVMELANRLALSKVASAAKLQPQAFDPPEAEHELSVQNQPASPLQVAVQGDDTVFSAGTKTLARVSTRATPVSPSEARLYARLVRYLWGGHPQILAALAQSNAIPAVLTLTVTGIGTTTSTLEVASVRPSSTGPIDIATIPLQPVASPSAQASAAPPPAELDAQRGSSPSPQPQTPVNRILARGAAVTDADIAAAAQRVQARVDADFRDDRPFDAYLGMIEWMLATGAPPLTLDATRTAALNADPAVIALRAALASRPKAAMPQAIDQLDALRPSTRTQGPMLDLFIANDRATLDDRQAALAGLVGVLEARPFLSGAYKDLGDNLLLSYDTPNAWRCWDIGRRIAPKVSTFQAVDEFERRLTAQHPEYF